MMPISSANIDRRRWPFDPGQPANPDLFVGREKQTEKISELCKEALEGKTKIGFIVGARGIGKTSLSNYCKISLSKSYSMAGFHIFLGGVRGDTARQDFFTRSIEEIEEEAEYLPDNNFMKRMKEFIKNIQLEFPIGPTRVKVGATTVPSDNKFIPDSSEYFNLLRNLSERIPDTHSDEKHLLLLILDDCDDLTEDEFFAYLLKYLVEENYKPKNGIKLLIILCGRVESFNNMVQSIGGRMSDLITGLPIESLTDDDIEEFFERAFSKVDCEVDSKAMVILKEFSHGKPRLMHVLGGEILTSSSSLETKQVTESDADIGVYKASELLGKEKDPQGIVPALKHRTGFRKVIMALKSISPELDFSKIELLSEMGGQPEELVDEFLSIVLTSRILDCDADRELFSFPNRLMSLYFHNSLGL